MSKGFPFCGTVLLAVFILAGCGSDNPSGKLPITGTVTLSGAPLDHGTIQFRSPDGQSGSGAPISDGSYSIPAEKGLLPGSYKVMIFSAEGSEAADEMPGEVDDLPEERIPAEYNVDSKEMIEVKDGQTNFDFHIE